MPLQGGKRDMTAMNIVSFVAGAALAMSWYVYFIHGLAIRDVRKTNTDLQHQLDDLKRRLEDLEKRQ